MNFVTKLVASVTLGAGVLLAPAAALAYYPYTYFSGPSSFNGGGGFYVDANYYGSSNCNSVYGCGNIGYNAMTGQWSNGGLMGGYGYGGYGYGSQMGYGSYGANAYSGGNNFYMQYVPSHVQQYMQMGYGNYGGYGGGFGGYNNGYIY